MSIITRTIKALHIDPTAYFFSDDATIIRLEAKESRQRKRVAEIIESPQMIAMEYVTDNGQRVILHRSTRPGIRYQLSFIDSDGIPSGHCNYIKEGTARENVAVHSRDDLLQHYVNLTLEKPLVVRILQKEESV